MAQTLRCTQCECEMTLTPLGPVEGEEHGVHLKIESMPALQCPNGHKRFMTPTFPAALLDELLAGPPLVPLDGAEKKGLLRRRYCCPACREVLDPHGSGRIEAERSIVLEGVRFGVHVDLPSYRCPSCAHECVEPPDAMLSDLMNASARAFKAAAITPG